MSLSYDLISEFVKITNDKKENTKEGIVYATVVNTSGEKYVKIDGSDLLTPIDTTAGIEDQERVTVMIKDHKATVTGNITSPSVGKSTVNKVVGTVVDENFVIVNSEIENLIAKNSYLENVYAENSTIVNSKIENLEATDSRIEDSVIENFTVIDGVVQGLKATTADIELLNANVANIKTLINGNLTSDNILAFKITSEKVTVEDAFIKDAMIDTISAGKINAGKINTNSVSIGSEDGGMLITGSTQQFTDKNGNVRIQIGKDASGDFTFILYGEDGTGQLINQNGITASAIGDGLIVNDMVSDNAAISGGKLDISSVITEINGDTSTTIKSSKIYLNEQAQSLEVAFNSLKTQVDTIQEVTVQGDLTAIVERVQSNTSKIEVNRENITTLISEDTVIKKQVSDLQGTLNETETTLTSKYTSLDQSLQGFKTTVADTYATKKSVTDVVDNISANYSTTSVMNSAIEQKVEEISLSVSNTYATKNEVNTLDDNLKSNYSTTKQMESAISVAKEEINLGVSSIYETKENVESKVNTAKQEAIASANDTLTSTISNYYTSVQTDSQIDVAKNAITQSVSSAYETKTDSTTKYNSLTTRISKAESKITDDAITNTVKKYFYTKQETENSITSKGYVTSSQVQQTADHITFQFTQSGGHNFVHAGDAKNAESHWSAYYLPEASWGIRNDEWSGFEPVIQINAPNGTTTTNAVYQIVYGLITGETYTFSALVAGHRGTNRLVIVNGEGTAEIGWSDEACDYIGGVDISGWKRVSGTFVATGRTCHLRLCHYDGWENSFGWFKQIQINRGSVPLPFSPHPSDIYDGITTIDRNGVKVSASNINGYTHMTEYGFFVNKGGKDLVSIDNQGLRLFDAKIQLTHGNGNKYFLLDENGIIMYNPANGTHQWGKVAAIDGKFTVASNGNSSGLSLGHHVNDNYVEDILCDSNGVVTAHRQMDHNGVYYNNYGQIFVRQQGQSGWEITGRSDSQEIKPGGENQGSLGSYTQYINQSWIANQYNPSSIGVKHVSHYVNDNECLSLVIGVKPARYFYKEYDEEGNDITTFTTKSSHLGLIYEDVRECSARDLLTNEEDKGINLYSMISVLWGATRNVNSRLNDAEYEIVLLKEEIEQLKNKLGEK